MRLLNLPDACNLSKYPKKQCNPKKQMSSNSIAAILGVQYKMYGPGVMEKLIDSNMTTSFDSVTNTHITNICKGEHIVSYSIFESDHVLTYVRMGGGERHKALGTVTLMIKLKNGSTLTIKDALFAPTAIATHISIGKAASQIGGSIYF